MESIFNIAFTAASNVARMTNTPETQSASKVQQPEKQEKIPSPSAKDEYLPEEKTEPSGRYWMGKDEAGQPKIYFDDPVKSVDAAPESDNAPDTAQKSDNPSDETPDNNVKGSQNKNADKKVERCVGSTDKVDREIERLKKKRATLEQQLSAETEEGKIKQLEQQLTQVESELRRKDNDTYRRQHTVFS